MLSTAVLTRLYPGAQLIRSRDSAWITLAKDRIIYDVGRAFNAATLIFDHHQRDAPLRDDGQPYSSFGLIWRHFGRDYLRASAVPEDHVEQIHQSFDTDFVLPVDLMGNGALSPAAAEALLADLTLPVLLESMKPVFDDADSKAETRAFHEALAIARAFVEAAIRRKAAKYRAEAMVMQAIADAGTSRVLELPQGMPFRAAIEKAGADHLLFVIHPRDSDWTLTGIRKSDDGFEQRADLPTAWAGLADGALEKATGIIGARFCHNGRFIAVAASRESIVQMARIAVEEAIAAAAELG